MTIAAVVAACLLGVIAVFQLALAVGMPARQMAWGGQYEGKLPVGLRIASAVAGLVLYPLAIFLILEAGGVTDFDVIPDVGPVGGSLPGCSPSARFSTWYLAQRRSGSGLRCRWASPSAAGSWPLVFRGATRC